MTPHKVHSLVRFLRASKYFNCAEKTHTHEKNEVYNLKHTHTRAHSQREEMGTHAQTI